MKPLADAPDLDAAADFLEARGQAGGLTEEQTVLTVQRLRRDAEEERRRAAYRARKRQSLDQYFGRPTAPIN
ncbi:hypothetical protein [Leifsonia sp. ALI-44-B]|uniref:hypothetical protein n=1 Tax=Leifsonia sp. ALI-44-B TaxID=1933776 RepID=UPI00117AEFB0|nr:hypothetical protein [Leifsonia sp. ALI-44-B]